MGAEIVASSLLQKFLRTLGRICKNPGYGLMINEKARVFFPLACCAVFSAATFGGIGVAALTGQIAVSAKQPNFVSSGEKFNQWNASGKKMTTAEAIAKPSHVGLTRSAIRNAGDEDKPMVMRVSQRFSQTLTPPCSRCGVIDSIERHELHMPAVRSATMQFSIAHASDNNDSSPLRASMLSNSASSAGFGDDRQTAISFIVRLRMEDGSIRTIYENQQPKFSVGERVKLENGSVISLS